VRCVDVNVLVYAHRPESQRHEEFRGWLDAARAADEPLGLADIALSGFVRVVTHPRVFREPTPVPIALDFVEALRTAPGSRMLTASERHWAIFRDLCTATGATGNRVPDAYLAALAIENGATWITADRGFARFPGLRWAHPLQS